MSKMLEFNVDETVTIFAALLEWKHDAKNNMRLHKEIKEVNKILKKIRENLMINFDPTERASMENATREVHATFDSLLNNQPVRERKQRSMITEETTK